MFFGCIGVVFVFILVIFYMYGDWIRVKSVYVLIFGVGLEVVESEMGDDFEFGYGEKEVFSSVFRMDMDVV